MMAGVLNWFWFAGAGCACAWLVVMVAYYKRRNILKNEMWQLLLISVIAILWDRFTGWKGWSVDFVIPFGILAVQFAVPSVICAGISFLTLAALFIFCKKDTIQRNILTRLLKILILMKIIVAIILTFQMEKQFIRFRISRRFMINVVTNILFCKHWRRQVK